MKENKQENLYDHYRKMSRNRLKYLLMGLIVCMSLFGTMQPVMAQDVTKLSGIVKDESGEPILGVTVMVKGTKTGTVTDINGQYNLELSRKSGFLSFSFVGMNKKEVEFNGTGIHNVVLKSSDVNLDEVVAIGYGTVKKRDLTAAITSIKGDEITSNPRSNPMEALQGKVPGLDIIRTSGQPGAGVTMQLRGTRSFTASGNPIFIIDGMPGDYSTLNPNDIESVEVLKDAPSTAIYGSSGANGVILITTKSGAAGNKTKVDFNSYTGYNGLSILPQMRYGESYIQPLRDAYQASGNWASTADDSKLFATTEAYQAYQNGNYINWAKDLLQTGITQNYSVAFSGGNEKSKAYASLNYSDEAGQYVADRYKVYSTNIRISHNIAKWLRIGTNLQGSYVDRNKSYAKLENALTASPLGSVYDANGNYNIDPVIGSTFVNLLLNNQENVYKNQDQNLKVFFNPYIEITPVKGLTILSRIGANLEYSRNNYFQGQGSYQYYTASGISATGTNSSVYAQITQNRSYGYKWENILTYNFKLYNDHEFTVTGVSSYSDYQSDYSTMKQTNIDSNKYLWYNMLSSSTYSSNYTSYSMSKGLGLIGRLNYAYKGKYLLQASVRYDGSSRLSPHNRWATFPAVSAGWRISEEKFMEGTRTWLDNLKLRAGYGTTGTASISPYSSASTMEYNQIALGGMAQDIYRYSQNYANDALTWEISHNTNLGLDATVLNNRIDLSVDVYNTNTDGVIWSRNLPITNGGYDANNFYRTNVNICKTNNQGIEVTLNTRNIVTNDFKWNSSVTFMTNKEKIIALQDGVSDNIPNSGTDFTLSKGYPVNSYYTYKLNGIWQIGQEADAAVFGAKPGDLKIFIPNMVQDSVGKFHKTVNGVTTNYTATSKYTPSPKDYQVIGHNSPDWSLGFQNTFVYKDFDLSIFAFARWGQMIKYSLITDYDPSGNSNFPTYFNYWTKTNPSNDFPAIYKGRSLTSYIGWASMAYVDGSYIKIKNITLGYSLPKKLQRQIGLEKFRVYATITNPLVIANSHLLKSYDPEMNGSFDYPLTKQLVLGLNVSF